MNVQRSAIGGLMLEENETWIFRVESDVIIGRRRNDEVGALRIRHCARNTLCGPLTHSYCIETARQMLNVPADPISYVETRETPCGPYGAATFANPREMRRVWYCNRPPGLIVGVYCCPAEFARDVLYALVCRESAHMMASAIFDRPSWGGDDPLTRVLTDGLEGAERDRWSGEQD